LPQARNVRRLRTPIVLGAIPVVVSIGGWITNLLTSGWDWWLFGVLAVVVGLSSVLAIVAETASGHSPAVDPAPGRPAVDPPQPVWLDVPSRSRHFTGRDDLLTHLDVQPENDSGVTALVPHALYGLGGVGKTHLAIEYVHRHRDRFDLVVWVPAEQQALLRSSFHRLAAAMGIAESDDVMQTMDLVRDGLRRGVPFRRWLVIFDNAEDPASLLPYLPEPAPAYSTGRVLITSRDRTWSAVADTVEVEVFRRRESMALLRKRNPGVSYEDAARLAERLGDLPLALEQASAWIEASGTTVPEYLRLLTARMHDLLQANRAADYPMSVAATWGVALDRLSATAPADLRRKPTACPALPLQHRHRPLPPRPLRAGPRHPADRRAAAGRPTQAVPR
jgi:NB-ARC domain